MYGEHTLLITHDLRKPGRNYEALYEAIKSASTWAHPVESVWLIRSNLTASTWRDKLKAEIDANDVLLVIDLDTGYWTSWNLSAKMAEWLQNNIKIRSLS